MEIRQLKYFVALARTLNFSDASRRLFITQGTLSQQIRQLEFEIGAALFDRNTRNVTLTEAGTELLPLALEIIEDSEACMNKMRELRLGLNGTLIVGTTRSFCPLLQETVKEFVKTCPGVDLRIQVSSASDLLAMTRNREVDLSLAYNPLSELPDIDSQVLFRTILSVVMRRDCALAGSSSLSLSDLKGQRIVMPGYALQSRRALDHFVPIDLRGLRIQVELNDPELMLDLVQSAGLVTLVSSLAAWYHTGLVAVPLDEGRYVMEGCVHRLKHGYRKRSAELFLGILLEKASIERIYKGLE